MLPRRSLPYASRQLRRHPPFHQWPRLSHLLSCRLMNNTSKPRSPTLPSPQDRRWHHSLPLYVPRSSQQRRILEWRLGPRIHGAPQTTAQSVSLVDFRDMWHVYVAVDPNLPLTPTSSQPMDFHHFSLPLLLAQPHLRTQLTSRPRRLQAAVPFLRVAAPFPRCAHVPTPQLRETSGRSSGGNNCAHVELPKSFVFA